MTSAVEGEGISAKIKKYQNITWNEYLVYCAFFSQIYAYYSIIFASEMSRMVRGASTYVR